jgi:hypothetical protein
VEWYKHYRSTYVMKRNIIVGTDVSVYPLMLRASLYTATAREVLRELRCYEAVNHRSDTDTRFYNQQREILKLYDSKLISEQLCILHSTLLVLLLDFHLLFYYIYNRFMPCVLLCIHFLGSQTCARPLSIPTLNMVQ